MCRRVLLAAALLCLPSVARADAFDPYINTVLEKLKPDADGVKELKQLTPETILENNRVLPDSTSALVVVQTNEGRMCKLLVQAARKRLNDEDKSLVNILLIEKYVTYKTATERAVQASGQNVMLFDGFQFSLDLGQVVPANLTPDIRFVAKEGKDKDEIHLEPVGKAKLFLLTKPLPEATPKKSTKFVIGEVFEPKYFTGKFKLYDDGRRSGTLTLEVDNEGAVTGHYFSDKDGERYKVVGKTGTIKHSIQFTVKLPRTEQTFQGWLFTGTGLAMTGWSKMQDREAGFYALRVEDE
ncbi:MAG: hypothetical protein JNM56_03075 [Planctomycetia bacterium]|nr:hypothetical protein [Planctomycetia bacterium]